MARSATSSPRRQRHHTTCRLIRKPQRAHATCSRTPGDDAKTAMSRLATELHDRVAQSLWILDAELAELSKLVARNPLAATEHLATVRQLISQAYRDVRLAIGALRAQPPMHENVVKALASCVEAFADQSGIDVCFETTAETVYLPPLVELQVLAILQQALANVRKHSGATNVVARFEEGDDGWLLTIEDNGRGFPVPCPFERSDQAHFGLAIMEERARSFAGALSVSSREGAGATVRLFVPRDTIDPTRHRIERRRTPGGRPGDETAARG